MVSNLRLAVLLLLVVSGLGIGMELHSELPEVDEAPIPEILEAHHQILDLEEQFLDISCNRTAESSSNGEEVSPFDPDRATALAEERSVPLASPELNPLHSHILVSASENQDDDNRHKRDRQVGGNEHNYAAASLGAKVLGANKEGKGAGNILVKGNDKYFRNPCSAKEKFVMVELAEEILVETFVIANYELYSSNPRELELLGSLSYPTSGWRLLGKFEARNVGQPQRFILSKPEWARYLQLRILSHYGTEFYCTLSTFEVFGVALGRMLEDLIGSSPGDSTSGSTTSVNKFLIEQILQLESDQKTFEEYVEFSNSQNTAAVNEYQEELTNIMRQLKSLNDTVQKQHRLADDVFSKSMKELRLCRKEVARINRGQIYSLTVALVAMLVVVAKIRILVRLALTGFLVILLLLV
ncbi:SUN domain-containing protein 4 [Selaginella moellendorffii]|uniref:SUN domain-containing protein 4 n=1 Tax=Selaginella moellendorffii TaxID=88036 RepID=UPI000D1C64E7|nr:SUN domain-containing protein 4 [Selaginella moellendorffii]XP_024531222.1 SUN domain-containing protein 4 [Selaginella moellendorffii]|eukprot:XP_024531221.1 SUN domain-containing protein 4 [Selaginella moellendorffii]